MKNQAAFLRILNKNSKEAQEVFQKGRKHKLSAIQIGRAKMLIDNAEQQKSLIAVVITSLLKKIESPSQDIRLHKVEFKGGYSGRSLDTSIVTPWLKTNFRRFAPKESGWLTRSIEQPRPFNLKFPGKIRNQEVKQAFLEILDDVETGKANPESYLIFILCLLIQKTENEQQILRQATTDEMKGCLTIDIITEMLEEHFAVEKASRLPVIAIYSIYQILLKNIKLYQDKELLPLKGHTASDRYSGFADIEIYTTDKKPFEMVEVKHGIPIDQTMIEDVLNKIKGSPIKRYFILTTAEPNFSGKKKDIFTLVRKIKAVANVDLIPNGIIPSLKYYLRLIPDLKEFIEKYTKNLSDDFKMSSDVKIEHISAWKIIIEKHSVPDIR